MGADQGIFFYYSFIFTSFSHILFSSLPLLSIIGILVETDQHVEPLGVAKIMQKVVESNKPDLVILGKQAIDDDSNQVYF